MRIVLDTNVLLSACLKPDGLEARMVELALNGTLQACVTNEVWAEYQDVLFREKFRKCRERAGGLLAQLSARVVRASAGEKLTAASDEDDNRFLECAAAAGAEYLVTGNLRHYPPTSGGTQVVNARGFFDVNADRGMPTAVKSAWKGLLLPGENSCEQKEATEGESGKDFGTA